MTAGNLILSFGLSAFSLPNHFLIGGGTGISRIVEYYFGVDLSLAVAVINISMFLVGLWVLGVDFALTTLVSSLVFPLFLNRMLQIQAFQCMTGDRLLAALAGGGLNGLGIGVIMRMGGSSGGMDIPSLILNKKLKLPVALSMTCLDSVILLMQVSFSSVEEILYGVVSMLVTTTMLNQVLVYGAGNVQVMIISRMFEEINRMIQNQMVLGTTLLAIETGHERMVQKAILCVLSNRDLTRLNQRVQQMDPEAFVIINGAREVRGRGFTFDRYQQQK